MSIAATIRRMNQSKLATLSQSDLARKLGCSRQRIWQLKAILPAMPRGNPPRALKPCPIAGPELRRAYRTASIVLLARQHRTSPITMTRWLTEAGIRLRARGSRLAPLFPNPEELKRLYDTMPVTEIARQRHCSIPGVYAALERYGIPRRPKGNRTVRRIV